MSDDRSFEKTFRKLAPLVDKKKMIRFAARCRDQDRQYEINNNCELDNGVYHKFVYSSDDDNKDNKARDEDDSDIYDENTSNEGKGVMRRADLDALSSKMKESTRNLNR